MISIDKFSVGLFFIGMGLGKLVNQLPAPLDFLNAYLSMVFFIVGVLFLISRP